MAKERTIVRMQAQIKRMSEQGYSIRAIARVLKLSRKTVRKSFGDVATFMAFCWKGVYVL